MWYVLRVRYGLAAPVAVPVEVRSGGRRVYRLSLDVGEGGMRLIHPAPFEVGRPVEVRFRLPDVATPITLNAELATSGEAVEEGGERGGCALYFLQPPEEARTAVARYVRDRLGLPAL
jgi:hypothetical protein